MISQSIRPCLVIYVIGQERHQRNSKNSIKNLKGEVAGDSDVRLGRQRGILEIRILLQFLIMMYISNSILQVLASLVLNGSVKSGSTYSMSSERTTNNVALLNFEFIISIL